MATIELTNKRILVLGGSGELGSRIADHLSAAGARVMLMSHLGRPTEGEFAEEFSMRPVADHLSGLLGKEVKDLPQPDS